jgi:hypothetical protein
MDKSSSIFDFVFRVINFRRAIRTGLMAIVLFIAGCTSKSVQPVVVATTTPEATATATIEPTPTLEPTPTIVPKPDYINDDNSVETDDGTVFVKDGKYMLYDQNTGEIREIKDISTDVTFATTEDASNVVLAMHAAEFANQEQLKKDMSPGALAKDGAWQKQFSNGNLGGSGNIYEGSGVNFHGLVIEFVTVKSPSRSEKYPAVGVAMTAVFGDPRPVPVVLGIFDTQGSFVFLSDIITTIATDNFPNTRTYDVLGSGSPSWGDLQQMLKGRPISCNPLLTRDRSNQTQYNLPLYGYVPQRPADVVAEIQAIIQSGLPQAGVEYDLVTDETPNPTQIGLRMRELEESMQDRGMENFYFLDTTYNLEVIKD